MWPPSSSIKRHTDNNLRYIFFAHQKHVAGHATEEVEEEHPAHARRGRLQRPRRCGGRLNGAVVVAVVVSAVVLRVIVAASAVVVGVIAVAVFLGVIVAASAVVVGGIVTAVLLGVIVAVATVVVVLRVIVAAASVIVGAICVLQLGVWVHFWAVGGCRPSYY